MSRYQPLADHLRILDTSRWDACFVDIEAIIGRPLPRSAYQYPAWWANQSGGHSQTAGWRDAGWKTADLDLVRKRVSFVREDEGRIPPLVSEPRRQFHRESESLWDQAREATGITNRDALIEAGLRALIARQAARELAAMGGTMPDAWVPERERPFA
jgi:hypothetical protein